MPNIGVFSVFIIHYQIKFCFYRHFYYFSNIASSYDMMVLYICVFLSMCPCTLINPYYNEKIIFFNVASSSRWLNITQRNFNSEFTQPPRTRLWSHRSTLVSISTAMALIMYQVFTTHKFNTTLLMKFTKIILMAAQGGNRIGWLFRKGLPSSKCWFFYRGWNPGN